MERAQITNCLVGADQKISNYLIKITFCKKVETATRSGFKFRFGVMGFGIRDSIWYTVLVDRDTVVYEQKFIF